MLLGLKGTKRAPNRLVSKHGGAMYEEMNSMKGATRPDVHLLNNWSVDINRNPRNALWVVLIIFEKRPGNADIDDTIVSDGFMSLSSWRSKAAMEAVWIRKFVGDLGVMPSINKPINMYCDNSAAITFANEPGVMKGARHFLRRYHYVREQVESGEIKLIKVHTDKNLADAFTKALPRGKVNEHANGIGLRLASSFMHICD
ncbi:hypothetical protein Tco_0636291 [Tanacetum coccineum]